LSEIDPRRDQFLKEVDLMFWKASKATAAPAGPTGGSAELPNKTDDTAPCACDGGCGSGELRGGCGCVSAEEHDRRVSELLEAVNDQVLKRRALAKALREVGDLLPHEWRDAVEKILADNNCGLERPYRG
jgi:hypothetical protein